MINSTKSFPLKLLFIFYLSLNILEHIKDAQRRLIDAGIATEDSNVIGKLYEVCMIVQQVGIIPI